MLRTVFTIVFLVIATTLLAAPYDLPTVIDLARERNATILQSASDLQSSSADIAAAYATALPTAQAGFSYDREFLDGLAPGTTKNSFAISAGLQQTLFRMAVLYAIQAARYGNALSQDVFDGVEQTVVVQVKKVFYQTLLLAEVQRVAEQAEQNALENYQDVRTRYESGVASEFDLLQAEVAWQNTIPDTMGARRDRDISLNNVKALIGVELGQDVELVGDLGAVPGLPGDVPFSEAASRRADRTALVWEQKLQELNLKVQRASRYPTLQASLTYINSGGSDDLAWENGADSAVLGVQLSVPLSTGGNTLAQIDKARAQLEKAGIRLAQLDDAIRIELSNSRLRMEEALQRIEATSKGVETADRTYELAQTRVDAGLATQLELQQISVLLSQAQVRFYSATFDYLSAYFDWELATGQVIMEGI